MSNYLRCDTKIETDPGKINVKSYTTIGSPKLQFTTIKNITQNYLIRDIRYISHFKCVYQRTVESKMQFAITLKQYTGSMFKPSTSQKCTCKLYCVIALAGNVQKYITCAKLHRFHVLYILSSCISSACMTIYAFRLDLVLEYLHTLYCKARTLWRDC